MRAHLLISASLACLLFASTGNLAFAKTLSSAAFSLAYGWSPTDPSGNTDIRSWNTNETATTNTPTTQGDFMFAPAPMGPNFSATGVSFVNRVLMDRGGYSARVGPTFELPVTGSFTGSAPADAAEVPNYRLRLEISKLSVWAGQHPSSETDPSLLWQETTSEHTAESPPLTLQVSDDFNEVRYYDQLLWNPDDYEVPLTNLNDSFTRVFDLPATADPLLVDLRYLEGLEIEGVVRLVYDAIPGAGLEGDYNENGVVDAADFVVWRKNPSSLPNEGASPGVVDQADYDLWKSRFGATSGPGLAAVVPEPESCLLILLGLALIRCHFRHK